MGGALPPPPNIIFGGGQLPPLPPPLPPPLQEKGYRTKAHPLGDRDKSNIIHHLQSCKRTAPLARLLLVGKYHYAKRDVDRFIAADK